MRQTLWWLTALALAVLLYGSQPLNAQKAKKPDLDKDKDKDASGEKMIKAGVLVGKVAMIYEDKRKIRLSFRVARITGPRSITYSWQDLELQAIEDVVVRTIKPREQVDDKGKIKRLTRAELKEQKGPDPKLPGYKAEFGDLQTDMVVQVTLVQKKSALMAKPVRRPAKPGKDNDAGAAADLLADNGPQVSMVMILSDPPPNSR